MTNLLQLSNPIWNLSKNKLKDCRYNKYMNGAWKIFLLGDGSPTRHLQLLTGFEVKIELIGMEPYRHKDIFAPKEIYDLQSPLLKRQVWLKCNNEILAWAESWWNEVEAENNLKNKHIPIWQSLTSGRSELFREVSGLSLVNTGWLEDNFNYSGPFWSRHYTFFRQSRELTVIREVFSPKLEYWLGKTNKSYLLDK